MVLFFREKNEQCNWRMVGDRCCEPVSMETQLYPPDWGFLVPKPMTGTVGILGLYRVHVPMGLELSGVENS